MTWASTKVRPTSSGQYLWEILAHGRALTWGTARSHLEASEAAKEAARNHYLTNASKRYPHVTTARARGEQARRKTLRPRSAANRRVDGRPERFGTAFGFSPLN